MGTKKGLVRILSGEERYMWLKAAFLCPSTDISMSKFTYYMENVKRR
jgi:hypothetical protein